jgi:predicted nuclease of predicted toxin-antitoxin system
VRFIVDAQLPPALARWLTEAGHDARHVEEVGLREAEDQPIWRHALENQAVIIAKDEDFALRVRQDTSGPVVVAQTQAEGGCLRNPKPRPRVRVPRRRLNACGEPAAIHH